MATDTVLKAELIEAAREGVMRYLNSTRGAQFFRNAHVQGKGNNMDELYWQTLNIDPDVHKDRYRWTKDEYLTWVKSRGPIGTWDLSDCYAADRLIKETALENFRAYIVGQKMAKCVRDWLIISVAADYGCVEVDDLLMELKCYPDWIVVNA